MNPFTRHPRRQGVTYLEHWRFAMGIAGRLLRSMAAFAVHSVFPFVSIPRELDLESTAAFITERNEWIEAVGASGGEGRSYGESADALRKCDDGLPVEADGYGERRFVPKAG
jgi:hypothetical protein